MKTLGRVYNFSAGPAVLPEEVAEGSTGGNAGLQRLRPVRDGNEPSAPKVFDDLINETEADLRDLMQIPDNYRISVYAGRCKSAVCNDSDESDETRRMRTISSPVSGPKKAWQEAQKYGHGECHRVQCGQDVYLHPGLQRSAELMRKPITCYICENNTIYGTKYKKLPNTKGKLLVSDVSSCFLSEPVNVSDYGILYGGVQKNIGPAGMVISVIREDLITDDVMPFTPTMMKFKTHADANSMYNTPNCYCIYMCGKVFKWIKKMGGLSAMKERNEAKAKLLYDYLDESRLFHGTVVKEDRSLMNVPFITGDKDLDAKFVQSCGRGRLCEPQGTPDRRRYARKHLQCDAGRRRTEAR